MNYRLFLACALATGALGAFAACSGSTSSNITQTGDGGGSGTEGGQSGEGGGSGVSGAAAAADVATALCGRFNDCASAFVTIAYGSIGECTKRLSASLQTGLGANGSLETPDELETCAKALPTASCADLVGRNLPDVCKAPAGTLTDGTACAGDSQCVNKRCKVAAGETCGTCTSPAAAGAGCGVDDDCVNSAKCVNSVCVALGGSGSTCDDTHPCNQTFGCVNGACGAPSAIGVSCKTSDECDQIHGQFCNGKMCSQVSFVSTPGACGLIGSSFTLCDGPASCGGLDGGAMGTCTPAPADGTSCIADGGAACEAPAVCQNGTCTLPDPASCK